MTIKRFSVMPCTKLSLPLVVMNSASYFFAYIFANTFLYDKLNVICHKFFIVVLIILLFNVFY